MKPLLLLHGALFSSRQFDGLTLDRPTATLDFAGHGGRPMPTPPDTECFVDELTAWLEANGPADVFGYSLGGYVALSTVRRRPELFGRVMTLATKLAWTPDVAEKEASRLDPAQIEAHVPGFALEMERLHADWKALMSATANYMRALGERPLLTAEDWSLIEIPIRMCVGDRDALVSVAETHEAARAMPQGSCVVFPATGHSFDRVPTPRLVWEIQDFFTD